jgi:hypothetical protein
VLGLGLGLQLKLVLGWVIKVLGLGLMIFWGKLPRIHYN